MNYGIAFTPLVPTIVLWIALAAIAVIAVLLLLGRARGAAVRASRTLTFIAHKPGLHTLDGPEYAGEVRLDDLGTAADVEREGRGSLLSPDQVRHWLPARRANAVSYTHLTLPTNREV